MLDIAFSPRLGPPLLAALLTAGPVQAQIVTDGSVGPKVSLSGGEIKIGAALGSQRGDNLFHSFEKFGITSGQTATFTGPGAIKNVISRVTGGEISNIDGKLASKVGQADLYFLNPAGVMFGPNATLDVPGSFHVSTAHELRFADGTRFSAVDKTGSGLTVAPPEAFGFLNKTPGRITVERSYLKFNPGQTLSLVGGDITIRSKEEHLDYLDSIGVRTSIGLDPGVISNHSHDDRDFGGTVNLISLTSPGQARVSDGYVEADTLGTIQLINNVIDIGGNGGGKLRIRGDNVFIDHSFIDASPSGDRDPGLSIDFQAGIINVKNTWIGSRASGNSNIFSPDYGRAGRSGDVKINAEKIQLNNTTIQTINIFGAEPNTVTLKADHIIIAGEDREFYTDNLDDRFGISGVIDNSTTDAPGGIINIEAKTFELRDYATITTSTWGSGNAGDVNIRAGQVIISSKIAPPVKPSEYDFYGQHYSTYEGVDPGDNVVPSSRNLNSLFGWTGIDSRNLYESATGNAGHVNITANTIELLQGGRISSSTAGKGNAGDINIQTDRLIVSRGAASAFTGIDSGTTPGSEGAGGECPA